MILRRASVVAVSTVAAIVMSAGAANAHFCFNKHAVQQGGEGMPNSEGFASCGSRCYATDKVGIWSRDSDGPK